MQMGNDLLQTELFDQAVRLIKNCDDTNAATQHRNAAKQRSNAGTLLLSHEANRRQDGKEGAMASAAEGQEASRTGPAESDMTIAAKASRAGPVQSGTATAGN